MSSEAAGAPPEESDDRWLRATWYLDSESSEVDEFARAVVGAATEPMAKAVALFHAVRDGFRYDPYSADMRPEAFRASHVARSTSNWCVPKSVLLAAAARNQGIPARLGFADVRNHLTSAKLTESMGTDVFYWHGYAELFLEGRWFKLSSAFNVELCEKFGTKVLEFDGTGDALMHPFDESGNRHMEYIRDHGSFEDLPLEQMLAEFAVRYGNGSGDGDAPGSAEAAGDRAFTAS